MTIFIVANCLLRAVLSIMMALCIVWFDSWLSRAERLGIGIMGGTGLMTVPVIYMTAKHIPSPYDGWASLLFTVGAIVFFSGWMHRKRTHDLANDRAAREAHSYLSSRGKI